MEKCVKKKKKAYRKCTENQIKSPPRFWRIGSSSVHLARDMGSRFSILLHCLQEVGSQRPATPDLGCWGMSCRSPVTQVPRGQYQMQNLGLSVQSHLRGCHYCIGLRTVKTATFCSRCEAGRQAGACGETLCRVLPSEWNLQAGPFNGTLRSGSGIEPFLISFVPPFLSLFLLPSSLSSSSFLLLPPLPQLLQPGLYWEGAKNILYSV